MKKQVALILVALLIVPLLLTACGTESRDTAKDYMKAVMKNDADKALELSCDSFDEGTQVLLDWYQEQGILTKTIDLKYDLGKGNNQKEIIVTGSYDYGDEELPREYVLSEKKNTRIVLDMKEEGGDWCVTEKSVFGSSPLDMTAGEEEAASE